MKWNKVRDLVEAGWHIGAHTHRHYDLDYLARKDPSGGLIREELETCDDLIHTHGEIRYADLVGALGEDEADGGPPYEARYITEDSDPYRLPLMELEHLIFEFDAFRAYLQGALEPDTL